MRTRVIEMLNVWAAMLTVAGATDWDLMLSHLARHRLLRGMDGATARTRDRVRWTQPTGWSPFRTCTRGQGSADCRKER